jgi:hypothetical protein
MIVSSARIAANRLTKTPYSVFTVATNKELPDIDRTKDTCIGYGQSGTRSC